MSKEIRCDYNLEHRHNSLCNLFCTKDKAVACNYKDTEFARENCKEFKDMPDTAPDIVVLDVSCEDHAEIAECFGKHQRESALLTYDKNPNYAIYKRYRKESGGD